MSFITTVAMSSMTIAVWGVVVGLTALFLGIAIYSSRQTKESMSSHYIADGGVSPFVATMSMGATLMSAFVLVGLSGFFYTHGVGSWVYVGWSNSAMFLLTIVFGYRLWVLGRKYGYVTPHEFLSDRYETRWAGIITGIITIIFMVPYMPLQLVGVGKLLSVLTDGEFSYIWGCIVVAVLGLILTQVGGMRTVARTDAIQGCFMFTVGLIIAFLILGKGFNFSLADLFQKVREVEPKVLSIPGPNGFYTHGRLFSVTLAAFFMPLSQIQISSRFLTVRDKKSFRMMMIGTSIIPIIAIPAAMMIGLGAKALHPNLASGDDAFMMMLLDFVPLPLVICAVLAVFAASLSTLDSMVLALGSIIGRDLLPKKMDEKKAMRISRLGMIILLVITTLFSFNPPKLIVTLSLASYSATLQFVPAVIAAYFWKRATKQGALASMIVGILSYAFLQYTPYKITLGGFDQSFWGFVIGSVTLVVVSLLTKPHTTKFDELMGYVDKVYPANLEGKKIEEEVEEALAASIAASDANES